MEDKQSKKKQPKRRPDSIAAYSGIEPERVLEPRHYRAIDLLIAEGRTKKIAEIAKEVGVSDTTINTWKKWPLFMAAYEARLKEWRRDLSDVRFADRKERVVELVRLYENLPDEAGVRDDGVTVYNHAQKARLLDQIADEVGDKVSRHEIAGPGGQPIQIAVHQLGLEELEKLDELLDRNEKLFQAQLQEKMREERESS